MNINKPLISIIIPTFNRAHLIGETLDSVLAQTYQNWECIVVDDGSTDDTEEVMQTYCQKDNRIKYFHRPEEHLPGGNGARNYGFKMSKGEYIQWFDSDDLMTSEKLMLKIKTILDWNVDFVISKSEHFNRPNYIEYQYNYKEEEVNFLSYATTHITWITNDMLIKRYVLEKISFNEKLRAGQEYNFSCKLLLETNSLKKIDAVLNLRRYHQKSIGYERREDDIIYHISRFKVYWLNFMDIKDIAKDSRFEKHTLLVCLSAFFNSRRKLKLPIQFYSEVIKVFKLKSFFFFLALTTFYLSGKYHYFYLKLK